MKPGPEIKNNDARCNWTGRKMARQRELASADEKMIDSRRFCANSIRDSSSFVPLLKKERLARDGNRIGISLRRDLNARTSCIDRRVENLSTRAN